MAHDGFLIVIFFVLALVIPAVIVFRVYSTALAGMRTKSASNSPTITPNDEAKPSSKPEVGRKER